MRTQRARTATHRMHARRRASSLLGFRAFRVFARGDQWRRASGAVAWRRECGRTGQVGQPRGCLLQVRLHRRLPMGRHPRAQGPPLGKLGRAADCACGRVPRGRRQDGLHEAAVVGEVGCCACSAGRGARLSHQSCTGSCYGGAGTHCVGVHRPLRVACSWPTATPHAAEQKGGWFQGPPETSR